MTTSDPTTAVAAAVPAPEAAMPPAWKPEPRQWQWKDLFTAPMLAFKPTCMVVSALTIIALGGLSLGRDAVLRALELGGAGEPLWAVAIGFLNFDLNRSDPLWWVVSIGFLLAAVAVFALGATLVSVFLRADLIDDEFLSVKEAAGQYAKRIIPALAVPMFLIVMGVGINLVLLYLPLLVGSIPYAGGLLYALLYPLGFIASIIAVLFGIALLLSLFVFPGIVATRQHGWFDNVVDTVEAIGTKPHVLFGGLLLTVAMAVFAYWLGHSAMRKLGSFPAVLPGVEIAQVERRAEELRHDAMWFYDSSSAEATRGGRLTGREVVNDFRQAVDPQPAWYRWGPGLIAGGWKVVILSLLLGYCLNLLLSGGLLTYLLIREDDYWDDEDLEDLDQLAKELEEEAKTEEAKAAAAAPEPAKT